jgi:F-type H+-transporting ATPase subunit epsilon
MIMASTFNLEILTPERDFFSGEVEMVIVKTPDGEMGILQGHVPMVVGIAVGPVKIKKDDKWMEAVLTEGFLKVTQEKTIIFTDTAEWPEEIDLNRAKAAKARAEEKLQAQLSQIEFARARAALSRAMARLNVTKHYR